jgi:hypothetical protein
MARRVIHIREDPETHTYQLELIQGRDETGKRWTRVYVTFQEAFDEAQRHMADANDEWRDITRAHRRAD